MRGLLKSFGKRKGKRDNKDMYTKRQRAIGALLSFALMFTPIFGLLLSAFTGDLKLGPKVLIFMSIYFILIVIANIIHYRNPYKNRDESLIKPPDME